ncbi:ARID4B (predicted), partial [Pycnogonum litorale]
AIEKAIQYLDYDVLPTHWDKDILLGKGGNGQDDQSDTETESSDDEPAEERDRFIAQLYNFMDERSTPINKAPSIGSKDLNLYKLFKLVQKFGGYNRVTNQTRWKNVYVKMGLPSLGPNGSVMVKHAYRKYLLGFEEIHKKLGYTMVGKESTRSGRSRNNRNLASFVAGPKKEVEEKKDNVAESDANRKVRASSMEDAHDTETRRASRVKSREDKEHKEDAVPPKKLKPDVVPKKETRNCGVNKMAEKSKDAGRGRQNRKDEIESQKVVEPATSLKRPGRKKSRVEEDAAKVDSVSNSLKNEEHIKNGPVSVGDRVKVEYVFGDQKKSYEAKVREIQIGYHYNNYLVHYTGWNMRYDEWINSTSIIECIPDSKQNAKKKQSSAPPPCQPPAPPTKVLDAAKAMKRGRPPGTGIVAKVPNLKSVKDNAPKLPPSRSPLPVSANKPNVTPASVPVSKVPKNSSSSSNEEVPVGRTVRSARLERKLSNQNLLSFGLEPKRRLRKTPSSSEALPNSSEDESESEPEIPVPRFSRRRKDSETLRRSCSLESNKRHNVKTASVKLEKAVVAGVSESDSRISTPDRLQDDADEDDAGSSDKDVIVDVLTESSESPTIEDIPTKEERSNDEIPNVECQESRIDEEKELDGVEANVTAPDREANVDLSVSSPVKTDESKPSENSAEIPIDEKEEPKASNVAKNTKKKGGKKKHKKQESSADKTDVRPEENEKQSDDKSGEATVEEDVPKKEVSAAVDDAAPTLEVVEMSAVDVVDEDQEMAEIPKICDDEGAIAVDPIETFPSKLDDVAMDSMNSEIPVLEEVGPARNENSDSVVEDTSKVESHNDLVEKCDGDVDETKVESTDAVKTKKKKAKEAKS